jgi:hypothetical protein
MLAVEEIVDGIVRTLRDTVLPEVPSRFARGQLYAAIDLLRNLRDRVEVKSELLAAEARGLDAVLARLRTALRAGGLTDPVERMLATVPAEPPPARVAGLRAAVVAALEQLDRLPDDVAAPARAALAEHLAGQALRDVMLLKPSLLAEIAGG